MRCVFLLNAFKHNLYLSQVGRLEKFLCIEIRVVVLFLNLSHFCHLTTGVLRKTQDNQRFTKDQFGQIFQRLCISLLRKTTQPSNIINGPLCISMDNDGTMNQILSVQTFILFRSVGTIIGAIIGGIVGLILLCVVSVVVCVVCCKKKPTPGTIIHPAGVTTVTSNSGRHLLILVLFPQKMID